MRRILPRDAFNDANLLKCIAKLTMAIEDGLCEHLQYHYDGEQFNINQNEHSGSTRVSNVCFWARGVEGSIEEELYFTRPLNSRNPWPLYLETENDSFSVFDDDGNIILTPDQLIQED